MDIAEHALYDKDASEKKWRKLLLVHKLLHSLLKNKMEKEMKKFEVVEKAFQKIKTATVKYIVHQLRVSSRPNQSSPSS